MAIPLAKKNFYFGFRIIDGHSVKNGSFLKLLKALSEIFSMTAKNIVLIVLRMKNCLQMECAKSYGAEYIVTRNVSDYSTSDMKAILPSEYLRL